LAEIRVKRDNGKINIGGRKLMINVYKLEDVPGIFLYEKNNMWVIAQEATGTDLHDGYFVNKRQAATAAIMFLKDFDLTQNATKLLTNPAFKKAIQKLNAAAKLKIGKGGQRLG
jgi:hypothetical protein